MNYRIIHKTSYKYHQPVSLGTHIAYLIPRSQAHHICTSHELSVTPPPASQSERVDYFGNTFTFFTIREPHEELNIEARSRVLVEGPPVKWPTSAPSWDEAARSLPSDLSEAGLDAYQFVFESLPVLLRARCSHPTPRPSFPLARAVDRGAIGSHQPHL